MPTGSPSDFASFLKQYTAEKQNVSNWDALFSNMLEQQYNAGAKVLEQQAQKDIGSAYGNYLASQIQMRHLDGVTEGYKNTLNKNIDDAYKQSVFTTEQILQQNKNQLLLDAGQQVADYKAQAEKSINEDATRMLKYQQDLLKHAASMEYNGNSLVDEYSELFKFDVKGNVYGWSDIGESFLYERYDPNNPANMRYSDAGKSFMGYLLQDFGDWAQMNYNAKDYGEWVDSGQILFNNAVFGSDINPYAGDPTVVKDLADPVRTAYIKQVSKNKVDVYAGSDVINNKDVAEIFTMNDLGDNIVSSYLVKDTVTKYLISQAKKRHDGSVKHRILPSGIMADSEYELSSNSKEAKQRQLMLEQANDLWTTGKLRKGDIFINNGFIAYSNGNGSFKYAVDTPENRKILEKAGIKIGK